MLNGSPFSEPSPIADEDLGGALQSCRSFLFALLSALMLMSVAAGIGRARPLSDAIALDKSIGAVSLGEPKARVVKRLGEGVAVTLRNHRWISYPRAAIAVLYISSGSHRLVFALETRSTRYKTHSGIGVGSRLSGLRKRVEVECFAGRDIECQHGYRGGGPGTTFLVNAQTHRIKEVFITYGH